MIRLRDRPRWGSVLLAAAVGLAAPTIGMGAAPTPGEVVDLLIARAPSYVADWFASTCDEKGLSSDACAASLGGSHLAVHFGRFPGQVDASAIALFSNAGTLGATGLAVATPLQDGTTAFSIPLSHRVVSARIANGRLQVTQDLYCSQGSFKSYGNYREITYSMNRAGRLVRSGRAPRC